MTTQQHESTTTFEPAELEAQAGAFAERIFGSVLGTAELMTVELGLRLGLYAALANGPASPPELAERAGIDARYAREWLEQQASTGILTIAAEPGSPDDADAREFALPEAHRVCLLDGDSLAYVGPAASISLALAPVIDDLLDAYRTGGGISFGGYGPGVREFTALMNRPGYLNLLTSDWLLAMPDVVARLETGGARVADIGCGCGWSSIAIARAYPGVTVDGFDLDEASIAEARANADTAGVADRVRFEVRNATERPSGSYDLACSFEALHDMAHPVDALRAMRAMTAEGGAVFIVDERAADTFTPDDPDPVQRFLYASSVLHCLPVGRSEEGSAATGAVMRTATLRQYASEAGFNSADVLPIEHDMFQFYRLQP